MAHTQGFPRAKSAGGGGSVPQYTKATVPTAATAGSGTVVEVTDAPTPDKLAISDGTYWRYLTSYGRNNFGNVPDPPGTQLMRLRADDDNLFSDGVAVPSISGASCVLSQSTGVWQPIMKNLYGGHKVLRMTGTDVQANFNNGPTTTTYSILIVYAYVASAGLHRLLRTTNVADLFMGPWNGNYQAYNNATNTGGPVTTDNGRLRAQLLVVDGSGNTFKQYVDSATQAGSTLTAPGTAPGNLKLGGSSEQPSSDVAEVIVWSRALSGAEITATFAYAVPYYGIT